MKNFKTNLFLFFLFIFCPLIANAIIGQTISYQGFLIGKSDNLPVNTPQDINFVFYDVEIGGTSIYSEGRCNVSVLNGRYEVEIGSVTSGGISESLFIGNPNIWLEVQIDPDNDCTGTYEPLQPRIKMQAAPYAFNSLYASTAAAATPVFNVDIIGTLDNSSYGAVTISSNLFVQGGISVGAISPGQKLSVTGIVESTGAEGGFMFPDGTKQITAAGETKWGVKVRGSEEDLYTLDGVGNVGIGVGEAPLAKLHVSSGAGESGNIFVVSTGAMGAFSNIFRVTGESKVYADYFYGYLTGAASENVLKTGDTMMGNLTISGSSLTITNTDTSVMNSIEITTDSLKNVYHFVVSTGGHVGIGLNNPRYKLHISSFDATETLLAVSTGTVGNIFEIKGNGDIIGKKFHGDGSGLQGVLSTDASKVLKTGDTMTGQLTISGSSLTVGGELYSASSIISGGEIYGSSLTVEVANINQGLIASSGTFKAWGQNQYSIETTSGIKVNQGIVDAPYFVGNGSLLTDVLGVDSTKLTKAGDTMTGKLHIVSSATEVYSLTVATEAVVDDYSMVITTQGNVGVQIANPTSPLHVYEQIRVSRKDSNDNGNVNMVINSNMSDGYITWYDDSGGADLYPSKGALGFIGSTINWDLIYRAAASNMSTGVEVFRIKSDSSGNEWKFGIGSNNPVEKFHVDANTLFGTNLGSPVLYVSTTDAGVGIATTAISHKLTVTGGIVASSSITANGGFYGEIKTSSITLTGNLGLGINEDLARLEIEEDGNAQYTMLIGTNTGVLLAYEKYDMVVTTQGRVGIGEDNPSNALHVVDSIRIGHESLDQGAHLHLRPETGPTYIFWETVTLTGKGIIGFKGEQKDMLFCVQSSGLCAENAESIRIKDTGNVVIGGVADSYTPTRSLEVDGDFYASSDINTAGSFYGVGGTLTSTLTVTGNAFSVGTSTFVVELGKVGIGIIAPSKELQTIGEIRVSTSATSTAHLNMAGAVDTLPTSGYDEGVMIYLTTDHTLYVSTETVATDTSWKAVW